MHGKSFCHKHILLAVVMMAAFFGSLCAQSLDTAGSGATVKIISAHKTEYRKDSETGNEVILFTGEVSLSVSQGGDEIVIEAESVTFNRAESLLYAEGNVVFGRKGGGSSSEKMTASALLFNTETQEGLFDDGRVVQGSENSAINLSDGQKLIINSDLFAKSSAGTVTFKDGTLTFCDADEPHWRIDASRIWLLPGNEFGFQNAVLYVGRIPVMYFPFFYYPKDEMLFNPVIGYDARKGYSIQTTTYLLGRKKLGGGSSQSSDSSDLAQIANFLKPTELKEQVREGLFLRNLEAKAVAPNEYIRILGDAYSNLGILTGIEGVLNPSSRLTNLSFSGYIGLSGTIFPAGGDTYTTWYDNSTYYDHSIFMGNDLPFRFGLDLKLTYKADLYSVSVELPVYSDPYFRSDFLTRSEDMDWIDFILNNPMLKSADRNTSSSGTSDLKWRLYGTISTPDFIKQYSPYVKSMSTKITCEIDFKSMNNSSLTYPLSSYSPMRSVYYPAAMVPLKLEVTLSGSLLPEENSSSSGKNSSGTNDYFLPDDMSDSKKNDRSGEEPAEGEEETVLEDVPDYVSKSMGQITLRKTEVKDLTHSLTYSWSPYFSVENHSNPSSFTDPMNISFVGSSTSLLSLKAPLSVQGKAQWNGSSVSFSDDLSVAPEFKTHVSISETDYPSGGSSYNNLLLSDYRSRKFDVANSCSLTVRPFVFIDSLKDSQISWKSSMKLLRTVFSGTADDPDWELKLPGWDVESITSSRLSLSLKSTLFSGTHTQSLTLDMNLPPMLGSITATLALKMPYCDSLSLSTGFREENKETGKWIFQPFNMSSSWSFLDRTVTVSQSLSYDLEESHMTQLSLSARWKQLDFSFRMGYSLPYELDSVKGWIAGKERMFHAEDLNLRYSWSSSSFFQKYDDLSASASVSTQLSMNLVRPTESYFTISPSVTFRINGFLDITFSSVSRNSSVFKYVQGLTDIGVEIPGEKNIFVDLFDSFAFWSDELRKKSSFKLNSLSLKVNHDLHDWSLNSELSVSPRLIKDKKPYYYDFSPYFKLSVVWKPVSSVKTTIEDKYGTFVLNP